MSFKPHTNIKFNPSNLSASITQHHITQISQKLEKSTNAITNLTSVMESFGDVFRKMQSLFSTFFEKEGDQSGKNIKNAKPNIIQIKQNVQILQNQQQKIIKYPFYIKGDKYQKHHNVRNEKESQVSKESKSNAERKNHFSSVEEKQVSKDSNSRLDNQLVSQSSNKNSIQQGRNEQLNDGYHNSKFEQVQGSIRQEKIEQVTQLKSVNMKKLKLQQKSKHQHFNNSLKLRSRAEQKVNNLIDQKIKKHMIVQNISSISEILSDYKDNFVTIDMINFNKIFEQIQAKQQQLIQSTEQKDISDLSTNYTINNIIQKQIQFQLSKWTTNLFSEICKSSFYGYINKSMDKNNTKTFFSRNCIYNLIKLKQQINKVQYFSSKQEQISKILKLFNKQSKQSLKFLKLKYPQQQKILFNKQISNLIPSLSALGEHKYQITQKLQFNYRQFTWQTIKQFINALIEQTNSKYQLFENNLRGLLEQRSSSETSTFHYLIGSKIKINTLKYTQKQIQQEGMSIKFGEIMRIIIKWIQNLESMINKIMVQNQSISMMSRYSRSDEQQQKKTGKQSNIFNNLNWLKQHQNDQQQFLNKLTIKIIKQVIQSYDQVFPNITESQYKTNIFTSFISLGIENSILTQTLLLREATIFQSNFKYLISLEANVLDLIPKLNPCIKISQKIIQVKNRLETPNRDYLINMKMKGTAFICELQLHINNGQKLNEMQSYRSHCQNDFNHFLYELQRSKFGPLAEMVSVYCLNSDLPGFFSVDKVNECRKKVKKQQINLDIGINDNYQIIIKSKQFEQEIFTGSIQLQFTICDFCSRASYNGLEQHHKLKSKNIVCKLCLVQKLSLQDKTKLFLKQFSTDFELISKFPIKQDNKSSKYYLLVNKQSLKQKKYIWKQFDHDNLERNKIQKTHYIYQLNSKDRDTVKQVSIFKQSDFINLLSSETLKLINFNKNFNQSSVYRLTYLQKKVNGQICIYPLDIKIQHVSNKNQKNDLLNCIIPLRPGSQCKIMNSYSYTLYRYIPQKLENNLSILTIVSCLLNLPVLNVASLQYLDIKVSCMLKKLQWSNLKLNKIKQLKMTFIQTTTDLDEKETIQEFILDTFSSTHLTNLLLKFEQFNQLVIKYQKQPSHNLQKTSEPTFHLPIPQVNQLQIQISKTSKQLSDKVEINFQKVLNFKLENLNISTNYKTQLNLFNSKWMCIKKLSINGLQYQNTDCIEIKGFNQQNTVHLSTIQQVYLTGVINSNLKYFPSKNLSGFECSNSNDFKNSNIYPFPYFQSLKILKLDPDNHQSMKFGSFVCLQVLEIYGLNQIIQSRFQRNNNSNEGTSNRLIDCSYLIQQFHKINISSLKKLLISQKFYNNSNQTYSISISQQLPNLQQLEIISFSSITISTPLPNLKRLLIQQYPSQILDLSLLQSTQLQHFQLKDYGKVQTIRMNPSVAVNLRIMIFKNSIPYFEGMKVVKNYFWSLKNILLMDNIESRHIRTKDLKWWNLLNIQETEMEIQRLLNEG